MESIKAHLLTLLDEVTQTLELAKKVKANDKKEINKLMRIAQSNGNYIDIEKDKIDEFYKENFKEKFSSANCTKSSVSDL